MWAKPRFDEAIHAPTRLRLCAMLRPLAEAGLVGRHHEIGIDPEGFTNGNSGIRLARGGLGGLVIGKRGHRHQSPEGRAR